MTLGERIKEQRTKCKLTQKDLSEKLNVSFQTVSKWENDANEPDLSTIKALCKIFNCSLDDLIGEEKEIVSVTTSEVKEEQKAAEEKEEKEPARIQIATCHDCNKPILSGDSIHHMQRKSKAGLVEMVDICDDCFKKHEELNRKKDELEKSDASATDKKSSSGPFDRLVSRNDSKVLIWSIVIGALSLVITLIICIFNYSNVGIGWVIGLPLIIGYCMMADVYCIFSVSYVSSIFFTIATWSIKFPGIIFSLDLDGLTFLIVMKILFFILGIFISIATFLLALAISSIFSAFSFVPLLIYKKNHD